MRYLIQSHKSLARQMPLRAVPVGAVAGGRGKGGRDELVLDYKQDSVNCSVNKASPVVCLQTSYSLGLVAVGRFQCVPSTSPKWQM